MQLFNDSYRYNVNNNMGCFTTKSFAKLYPDTEDSKPGKYVHYLSFTTGKWRLIVYSLVEKKFTTLNFSKEFLMFSCESIAVRSVIYCSGGSYSQTKVAASKNTNAIYFRRETPAIKPLSPLKHPRYSHCFVSINENLICAVGGLENSDLVLSTCEFYNISTNEWIQGKDLNYPKAGAAACSLNNRFVFIFGARAHLIETIEYLDYVEEQKGWSLINCAGDCTIFRESKLWCTQVSENKIILFGAEKIGIFDKEGGIVTTESQEKSKCVPDKRGEIKMHEDEVIMVLEAGGNIGSFCLKSKKWQIQPHIVLAL